MLACWPADKCHMKSVSFGKIMPLNVWPFMVKSASRHQWCMPVKNQFSIKYL